MPKIRLNATKQMAVALAVKQAKRDAVAERQQAERSEGRKTWHGIQEQIAAAEARGEVVDEPADRGPINVLSRDGMMWLIKRKKLTGYLRVAAERFRHDYEVLHLGGIGSCISGGAGGGGDDMTMMKVQAASKLVELKIKAFLRDEGLINVMEAVAGRGETLRDLAMGNQKLAELLEAEFIVACRLVAAFYAHRHLTN
jgi:hypothetical protein